MSSSFPVSENVALMQSSATLAAMQAAENLRAAGVDVCDFGPGEPDFDTPENIKQAAERAMRAGRTKYTANAGIRELQRAIIDFYRKDFAAEYEVGEVMATAGGKQAIFNACVTLLNPGDEVLIPKPYWVTFPEIAVFARATPVFIETEETDFVLTAEQVERAITPKTKLLILNSPSNPSGRVLPPSEFRRVMELTSERGIYVVSDECYLRFVYPPGQVFSAASLVAELRSRLCIAGSFSKTYAMTGWRIGYCGGPRELITAMSTIQGQSTSNASSISQKAATVALSGDQSCVTRMNEAFKARHDFLVHGLNSLQGVSCLPGSGTFYAFADVSRAIAGLGCRDDNEFAELLLTEGGVAVVPGSGFGAPGHVRLSFACGMETLQKALERIDRVLMAGRPVAQSA